MTAAVVIMVAATALGQPGPVDTPPATFTGTVRAAQPYHDCVVVDVVEGPYAGPCHVYFTSPDRTRPPGRVRFIGLSDADFPPAVLRPGWRIRVERYHPWYSAKSVTVLDPPTPDLDLAVAVEAWVAEAVGGRVGESGLPPIDARPVRDLSSANWHTRAIADANLAYRGRSGWRPMAWAARSRDPEVRERGRDLLGRIGVAAEAITVAGEDGLRWTR